MHSLRTRLTLVTICLITIVAAIVTAVSVHFIRKNETRESDQLLLLMCETGERNLDYFFDSVQKSLEKVETSGAKLLGTVLTDMKVATGNYGRYGRYGRYERRRYYQRYDYEYSSK